MIDEEEEKMLAEKKEDDKLEGFFDLNEENDASLDEFDEDMLVDLAEGKKVKGRRLNKNQKRELKHAI